MKAKLIRSQRSEKRRRTKMKDRMVKKRRKEIKQCERRWRGEGAEQDKKNEKRQSEKEKG